MRVTKRNLKGKEGEIAITPETLDDLWHLKYIIEPGDVVFSLTKRRVEGASDKLRPEKIEKKPMRLGVRIEKVEFHKFSNRLRLHGMIESGQDAGAYHSLKIEEGTNLSVIKTWKNDQLARITEAEAAAKRPRVVIVTIEEGEASIGLERYYGVEEYSIVKVGSGKGALRKQPGGESHADKAHAESVAAVEVRQVKQRHLLGVKSCQGQRASRGAAFCKARVAPLSERSVFPTLFRRRLWAAQAIFLRANESP